uniref:Uncharacterized protein n=1 Tax=Lepeophtheirus salmonis TaxID=72036 RepID=A0A0K2TVQ9_LEPSM
MEIYFIHDHLDGSLLRSNRIYGSASFPFLVILILPLDYPIYMLFVTVFHVTACSIGLASLYFNGSILVCTDAPITSRSSTESSYTSIYRN